MLNPFGNGKLLCNSLPILKGQSGVVYCGGSISFGCLSLLDIFGNNRIRTFLLFSTTFVVLNATHTKAGLWFQVQIQSPLQ